MSRDVTKSNKNYIVTIFKNVNKRWGIGHPSNIIHHKDFASYPYAVKFCKRQDWLVDPDSLKAALARK